MSAIGTKRTSELHCTCPLLGVKRTCRFALHMSAFDPKRAISVDGYLRAGGVMVDGNGRLVGDRFGDF